MNCMKCGREIESGQVFCSHCLELMAQHPVKPVNHLCIAASIIKLCHQKDLRGQRRTMKDVW